MINATNQRVSPLICLLVCEWLQSCSTNFITIEIQFERDRDREKGAEIRLCRRKNFADPFKSVADNDERRKVLICHIKFASLIKTILLSRLLRVFIKYSRAGKVASLDNILSCGWLSSFKWSLEFFSFGILWICCWSILPGKIQAINSSNSPTMIRRKSYCNNKIFFSIEINENFFSSSSLSCGLKNCHLELFFSRPSTESFFPVRRNLFVGEVQDVHVWGRSLSCYRSSTSFTVTCLRSPDLKRKKNDYKREKLSTTEKKVAFKRIFFFFDVFSPAPHYSACTIDWFLCQLINVRRILIVRIVLVNWSKSNDFDISLITLE